MAMHVHLSMFWLEAYQNIIREVIREVREALVMLGKPLREVREAFKGG